MAKNIIKIRINMKAKLYFHKDPLKNFGDDLNPWLWSKLMPEVYEGVCYHDPKLRTKDMESDIYVVGIGTLLKKHIPTNGKKCIFGTGMGYGEDPKVDDTWAIYSVRGPRTAARLGFDNKYAVTDDAILTAKIGLERVKTKFPIAYMPHVSSARNSYWKEACESMNVHYIDPEGEVDEVFEQLLATDVLITEAMHGAILADTLRVPWIPVTTTDSILEFKWKDWCESMGIEYNPVSLPSLWHLPDESSLVKRIALKAKMNLAKSAFKKGYVRINCC